MHLTATALMIIEPAPPICFLQRDVRIACSAKRCNIHDRSVCLSLCLSVTFRCFVQSIVTHIVGLQCQVGVFRTIILVSGEVKFIRNTDVRRGSPPARTLKWSGQACKNSEGGRWRRVLWSRSCIKWTAEVVKYECFASVLSSFLCSSIRWRPASVFQSRARARWSIVREGYRAVQAAAAADMLLMLPVAARAASASDRLVTHSHCTVVGNAVAVFLSYPR